MRVVRNKIVYNTRVHDVICFCAGSQAHSLLLTLPASRLKEAFQLHPALHNPLLQHVQNLPAPQVRLLLEPQEFLPSIPL